jgi:hypothetical protein
MTARIVSSSFRMGQGGAATASGTLQWDVGSNSGDISGLHASDKVCEKTTSGGSGYSVFVCKQRFPATGTHTIDVRVDSRSTEMAIGVVKSFSDIQSHDKSSKGWIGGGSNGWGVFNDGDGCHSGSWNSLSPGFSSGDTVKIIYNADAGTFGWAVKGTTHSAVYSGVTGPVYLAVSMGASGTCKTTIAASSFPMGTTDVAVASDAPHSGTTPEYEWLVESPMTAVNDIVECGQASGFSGYKAAVSKIAFPSTGTHYVEVNVERRDDSMAIGVVKSWDLLQTHSNGSKGYIGNGSHGWCLFSDGDGAHDGSWKGGSPGISSGTGGTKVKLVFNADRGDLGWVVGGTDRGVVYTGLPTGQGVYFAVAMGSSGGRVKILSASFPMGGAPSAAASAVASGAPHSGTAFKTVWSRTHKQDEIVIDSDLVARNPAGGGKCVWSEDTLPSTGCHYWEVTMNYPGKSKGDSMGNCYMVGVTNHTRKDISGVYNESGTWGLSDYGDSDALRVNGSAKGSVPNNSSGKAYGSGDRVGVLADMDARPRTLQFFRDGQRLDGAVVAGFPEGVRIAAVPYNSNVTATLAFPVPAGLTADESARLGASVAASSGAAYLPPPAFKLDNASTRTIDGIFIRQHDGSYKKDGSSSTLTYHASRKGQPMWVFSHSDGDGLEAPAETKVYPPLGPWYVA